MKLLNLFAPTPLSARVSIGLLLVRVVVGIAFMFHGWGKIQNPFGWMGENASIPGFFQMLAAVSEFIGGLFWVIGLLTPLASFGLACTMAVAVYFHAVVLGDPFASRPNGGAYEPASVYLAVSLLLLLAGPGRFALDALLFKRKTAG